MALNGKHVQQSSKFKPNSKSAAVRTDKPHFEPGVCEFESTCEKRMPRIASAATHILAFARSRESRGGIADNRIRATFSAAVTRARIP